MARICNFILSLFVSLLHFHSEYAKRIQRSFVINYEHNCFMKDNEPFRYISGGMHYFRIPSMYWKDRLMKAKTLGVNTIQTNVAWNVHEKKEGVYDFTGENDLLKFIDIAEELGLLVILRPGPYIDAEWEFGGFPWWLAKNRTLQMRTSDASFMFQVERWFDKLLPLLESRIYKNGGPIIAFQVENEYGSYYACDKQYLQQLKAIYDKYYEKDSIVLFTVDGYTDDELKCGTIQELYKTVDFGSDTIAIEAFKQQRKYQPSGPLVNSEYYTGWLDYWGSPHQRRDANTVAARLDMILSMNASVNLYMLHGGTNFGFMNGMDLNFHPLLLKICPTSYDYDAPLSEAGDTTDKYFKIRDVLKKYVDLPPDPIPKNTTKSESTIVPMYPFATLNDLIDKLYDGKHPITNKTPLTMEDIEQGYGMILYRTKTTRIKHDDLPTKLVIDKVSDRMLIIVDGKIIHIIENGGEKIEMDVTLGQQLDILVENQGRAADALKGVHYLPQTKGIMGMVKADNISLLSWKMYSINDTIMEPMHKIFLHNEAPLLSILSQQSANDSYIVEYFGIFDVSNPTDSFLHLDDFDKGQVYINGFNVGRFWQSRGPQKTLFVPQSFIRIGINAIEIISLSKLKYRVRNVKFVKEPILG